MIIATAGHVDHGKTSLVKQLTGVDTDRLPEEKKRGMSIDLGFAYKKINNQNSIGYVDVPGHENFIQNMISGLAGVNFVLLVIAADDGPKTQTFEHLEIINLLGIKNGAVAITKIDKVDEKKIVELESKLKVILKETSLSKAPIFRISSLKKNGIQELQKFLEDKALDQNKKDSSGGFRLAVDRKFFLNGIGLIVTGSVLSGKVNIDDKLLISPKNLKARVKTIHSNSRNSETGISGQRCALNLQVQKNSKDLIQRGDLLLSEFIYNPSKCVDAIISVSSFIHKPLKNWSRVHMHIGTAKIVCRIIVLEKKEIFPGQKGLVQLKLEKETSLVFGDRFILRDQSAKKTIAGGQVIDPNSSVKGRSKASRIEVLNFQVNNSSKDALLLLVSKSTWGIDLIKFSISRNFSKTALKSFLKNLQIKIIIHKEELWGISEQNWRLCKKNIFEFIGKSIAQNQNGLHLNKENILSAFSHRAKGFLVDKILNELIEEKQIFKSGQKISITSNRNTFNSDEKILWIKIKESLNESNFNSLTINEFAEKNSINIKTVESFLNKLVSLKQLCKISEKRYFLPKTILKCANIVEKIASENNKGLVDLGVFRNETKISRNISIELLEFFDKKLFTLRSDNGRIVKSDPSNIFK